MSSKIGFWSVFAIVTGSQIGSGVFMLPANLAPFGLYGLLGWLLSGIGAIALCLVFASLCERFPETGGPHAYVRHAFGPTLGFFSGWTYWTISWVSTTTVIVTSVGYLTPFLSYHTQGFYLFLEIALLFIIVLVNLKGVKAAGRVEFFLAVLKFIPLIILPIIALFYFDPNNFVVDKKIVELPTSNILGQVTLLTLWGFIGLESATTPAGSVENPSKTIPRAIVLGTLFVAFLYVVNCVSIMGLIPGAELEHSKAPYVDATIRLFGGNWHLLVSLIASIVCVGTLNAWVLTSSQIALGLAQDGFIPKIMGKKNKNDAPYIGILASSFGIVPLLVLTANKNLSQQIGAVLDISVTAFLFVYFICCISFIKFLLTEKRKFNILSWIYTGIALMFCAFIMYETPLRTLCMASLFTVSGIPLYLFWYRCKK